MSNCVDGLFASIVAPFGCKNIDRHTQVQIFASIGGICFSVFFKYSQSIIEGRRKRHFLCQIASEILHLSEKTTFVFWKSCSLFQVFHILNVYHVLETLSESGILSSDLDSMSGCLVAIGLLRKEESFP